KLDAEPKCLRWDLAPAHRMPEVDRIISRTFARTPTSKRHREAEPIRVGEAAVNGEHHITRAREDQPKRKRARQHVLRRPHPLGSLRFLEVRWCRRLLKETHHADATNT